ncbi:MAG: hypothetical protein WC565_10490, partial [Parcubacteria group bacterium]
MSLLQFMDFKATDFTTTYPDIKPGVGGVWHLRWDQFNPAQGQFDVSIIERWLAAEAKNKLHDGTAKPLIAMLLVHTAPDEKDTQGVDYSPGWVQAIAPSLLATAANGTAAKMPAYNSALWWIYLTEAVKALGAALDGRPQVIYVAIGHGCDAELWAMKSPWNAKMPSGVERTFGVETVRLLDTYKVAFPTTPLLVRATPGSGRKTFTMEAIKRGIGVQMCGMQVAAQNAHGWGNEFGTWDMLKAAKAAGVPAVAESTFGMGSGEAKHWAILGMLGMRVDAIDVHPPWLEDVPADTWNWAVKHMGCTAETAPDAFIILRDYDTKYPPIQWTGSNGVVSGQSDWPGDFCYYMTRTSPDADAPRFEDIGPSDAPESRQCRRITSATFEISLAAEGPYDVAIRWLDEPGHWLSVDGGATMLAGTGSGQWDTLDVTVDARR